MEDKAPAPTEQEVAAATQKLVKKKSKRGGPRPGAGRKPNYLKKSGIPSLAARLILAQHDLNKLWGSLLTSRNEHVRLNALIYLYNRIFGCPKQVGEMHTSTEHAGSLAMKIEFVTPGRDHVESTKEIAPTEIKIRQEVLPPPSGPGDSCPLPTSECGAHGRYTLSTYGAPQICPSCAEEAAAMERKLKTLIPGGA